MANTKNNNKKPKERNTEERKNKDSDASEIVF